jgi:hypothetical protein
MALTINGILCQEIVGQFTEGFSLQGGPVAHKGFLCNWNDRYTVAQGLLGLSSTTHVGGSFTLQTPAKYPEIQTIYAHEIQIQPVGRPFQGQNQLAYPQVIVWAGYQALPWSFEGLDYGFLENQIDPATPMIYCKQNLDISTELMTIPGIALKFSNGNKVNRDYRLPIVNIDLQITFIRVPYLPAQALLAASLKPLNSTTFLGQAAGFVLFNGAHNEQTRATDGTMTQDLTLSFSWRSIRWDFDFNPKTGTFLQVQDVVNSNPVVQSSDLNQLLIPGYVI